jgi:hypothetical protein
MYDEIIGLSRVININTEKRINMAEKKETVIKLSGNGYMPHVNV